MPSIPGAPHMTNPSLPAPAPRRRDVPKLTAAGFSAIGVLLMTPAGVAAHPERNLTMEITRKADQKTVDGPADYFTGKVTITGQFQRPAPSRVSGAIVHFEPGARTAWHTHPLGQTLIVTEGIGWTQIEGGPILEFHAGDVLW